MGVYVNPADGSDKVEWLTENAVEEDYGPPESWDARLDEGLLPVCLVDNGFFTAAAVIFDEREFIEATRPDARPRIWYLVPIEYLIRASNLTEYWRR